MNQIVKSILLRLTEEAIKAEGAYFEHYDKHDKEGQKLKDARKKAKKELTEFIEAL